MYQLPLPLKHRFPMEKYDLLPRQLIHEGSCTKEDFFTPTALDRAIIERIHHPEYVKKLLAEFGKPAQWWVEVWVPRWPPALVKFAKGKSYEKKISNIQAIVLKFFADDKNNNLYRYTYYEIQRLLLQLTYRKQCQ